jgi:hypothetical protein
MSVNICCIARNEGLYIREWVLFHQIVGVEHITLYNNNSDDNMVELLKPFVESGFVDVIDWPMPNPSQLAAYNDYICKHRGPFWCAFIDVDEFMWSPKYNTIQEGLDNCPAPRSAIGVNWMVLNSGGQTEYEDKPVIERFTWRPNINHPVDQHVKSVIWMDQNVSVIDPHHFNVEHGTFNEQGAAVHGPFSNHSSEIMRINHYSSKSLAEWRKRILLGKPDRGGIEVREDEWYWDRQQMEVDDHEIQRYLPELKRRLECQE